MTVNKQEQWKEEALESLRLYSNDKQDDLTIEHKEHLLKIADLCKMLVNSFRFEVNVVSGISFSAGYLSACKKRDKEIEDIKRENEYILKVNASNAEFDNRNRKEIAQLKSRLESEWNEFYSVSDISLKRFNEIEQLKEQLKRETECVDDIVLMDTHAPFCRFPIEECSDQCMDRHHYNLESLTKHARSVQAQREDL